MKLKTSKKIRYLTVLLAFTMLLTILPGHSIATTATRGEGTTSSGYDYSYGMKTITETNETREESEITEIASYREELLNTSEVFQPTWDAVKSVFEIDTEFHIDAEYINKYSFSASGYVVTVNGSNLAMAYVGLTEMNGNFNFTITLAMNINMTASYVISGIKDDTETVLVTGDMTFGVVVEVTLSFEVDLTWYGTLQLISQAIRTPDNSFMIWQNMMQDFLVYKDVNGNDVFDLNLEMLDITDIMKEEFKGYGLPGIFDLEGSFAVEADMWMDMVATNNTHGVIEEVHLDPSDPGGHEEASESIETTYPPGFDPNEIDVSTTWGVSEAGGLTTFEWSTTYENMPTTWNVSDSSDTWVNETVPQNYTYGYEYVIDNAEGTADLYTTFSMSEMPESDIKDAVDGYGLALPTYAAFLVVDPVESSLDDTYTQPVEVFSVSYQDETYAEYKFGDPEKVEYDWSLGLDSAKYNSTAASVNVAVIEGRMHGTNMLEDDSDEILDWLIFSEGLAEALQDTGEEEYDFTLALNLFTTNYHKWDGGAIEHDPVMRAYFLSAEEEGDDEFEMPAALAVGVLAAVIAVLFFM
ncbi:MAG: hypothetical protein ACFE68_06300, partial [Candidatus Hodarchaeota archaeon]